MTVSINIPHEDISIKGEVFVPNSVIVVFAIVCHALSILEGIFICAKVITDANPKTIVKNKRIRFLTERLFDQTLWALNIVIGLKY